MARILCAGSSTHRGLIDRRWTEGVAPLAADVVFKAPGGVEGKGRASCVEFYGGWLDAFPDGHVDVTGLHIVDDVAVEEGTFTGTRC
jgi:SnoaL-like domain